MKADRVPHQRGRRRPGGDQIYAQQGGRDTQATRARQRGKPASTTGMSTAADALMAAAATNAHPAATAAGESGRSHAAGPPRLGASSERERSSKKNPSTIKSSMSESLWSPPRPHTSTIG